MQVTDDAPNAASVALIRGGRILLVQRAYAPYKGFWTFPGGRLEPGESAVLCAMREVREELGLAVTGLIHVETQVLSNADAEWRLAVFVSTQFGGDLVISEEIAACDWVVPYELHRYRTTAGLYNVIERAFAAIGKAW